MKLRAYRNVRFDGDWEINLIGRVWNLRIGRSQIALWRNYEPVFCWLSERAMPNPA